MSGSNQISLALGQNSPQQALLPVTKVESYKKRLKSDLKPKQVLSVQIKSIIGEIEVHEDAVTALEITKDSNYIISGSEDSKIHIWDTFLKKIEMTLEGHNAGITCLSISFDNKYLLSGSKDGKAILWNFESRTIENCFLHLEKVNCVTFANSETFNYVLTCSDCSALKVWDFKGELVKEFDTESNFINSCIFINIYAITGSSDGKIIAWDLYSLSCEGVKMEYNEAVLLAVRSDGLFFACSEKKDTIDFRDGNNFEIIKKFKYWKSIKLLKFSKNDKHLVVISDDYFIDIWNGELEEHQYVIDYHPHKPISMCINDDCSIIVNGFSQNCFKIWNSLERRDHLTKYIHDDAVRSIACTSDERFMLSGSSDKTIKITDLKDDYKEYCKLTSSEADISEVNCLKKFNNIIISTHSNGTLKFWDLKSENIIKSFNNHVDVVRHAAISEVFQIAASCSKNKIIIWNLTSLEEISTLSDSEDSICLEFFKKSKKLISGGYDHSITIWNLDQNKEEKKLKGHSNNVCSLALSKEENNLFSGSTDNLIIMWSLIEFTIICKFEDHKNEVRKILLTSTDESLISASLDHSIIFWNIKERKKDFPLIGHKKGVLSIILNKDEKELISGGRDFLIIVWNLSSRSVYFMLSGHDNCIRDLILVDDTVLLSCSDDKTIREWDLNKKKIKKNWYYDVGSITTIAIANNNILAAAGNDKGYVLYIDLITKSCLFIGKNREEVRCLAFSNDSKYIASASEEIKIWEIENFNEKSTFKENLSHIFAISFNYNSKLLITGSLDKFTIWNIQKKIVELILTYKEPIYCLVSSKQQNFAYFGCDDKFIRAVNLTEKNVEYENKLKNRLEGYSMILDPSEKLLIFSDSNSIVLFDTIRKELMFKLTGHSKYTLYGLAYLPTSKTIISCAQEKSIKFWRLMKKREMHMINFDNSTTYTNHYTLIMDITSDGKLLVCGQNNGDIKIWEINNRSLYFSAKGHNDQVLSIKISLNDDIFASGSNDKSIKIWSIKKREYLFSLDEHSNSVRGIFFMHYNNEMDKILVSCSINEIIYWDLIEKKPVFIIDDFNFQFIHLHNDMILTGYNDRILFWQNRLIVKEFQIDKAIIECITSRKEKLAIGSNNGIIHILDIEDINNIKSYHNFEKDSRKVISLIFLDENILISSLVGGIIRVWDIKSKEEKSNHLYNNEVYNLVKLSENKFISCSKYGALKIWDFQNKEESFLFKGPILNFTSIYPTSKKLFIGSEEGAITIFDLEKNRQCNIFWDHKQRVTSLELYENESILISGSYDKTIKFWDLNSNSVIITKLAHKNRVNCLRITPNNKYLISSSADCTIIIWELSTKTVHKILKGHKGAVNDIRIGKESKNIFSCSSDYNIKMWDIETGNDILTLTGHSHAVWELILIEEKRLLISCSRDKLIKIWNYESQQEIFNLKGHTASVDKLETSTNYKYLISGSSDCTVKIWNLSEKRLEYTINNLHANISGLKITPNRQLCICSFNNKVKFYDIFSPTFTNSREIKCKNKSLKCNNTLISEAGPISQLEIYSDEFLPTDVFDLGFNSMKSFYCFYDYIKKNLAFIIKPETSLLKVSNCLFGVAHILAYLGKDRELSVLLETLNIIFCDIFGKSPFYYSIVKNNYKCAEIILEFLIKSSQNMACQEWESSIHSIRGDYIKIINSSIYKIGKFFKYSMTSGQVIFLSSSVKIPCSKITNYEIPMLKDFDDSMTDSKKIQVYIKSSRLPLPAVIGSKESIKFLRSVLNCQDKEILSSEIIEEFINNQWDSLYPIIIFNSITYFINLVLILLIFIHGFETCLFVSIIIVNSVLALWEIAQFIASPKIYLNEIWNRIDIVRFILTIFWLFYIDSNIVPLNIAMVLINFIRGITAFKMFDGTRYYIKLIFRSISEVKYFLLMFMYWNIALGSLYFIRLEYDRDFLGSILKIYNINFGYFNIDELQGDLDLSIFILATILNLVIMLNLLISILGDSHDNFQLERNMFDNQEKAEACLEIQTLLCWRRSNKLKVFLHIALNFGEKKEKNRWKGRAPYFKNQIMEINESIKNLQANLLYKIPSNLESNVTEIKEKFEMYFNENSIKEDENHDSVETKIYESITINKKENDEAKQRIIKEAESDNTIESSVNKIYESIASNQKNNNEAKLLMENKIENLERKIDNLDIKIEDKVAALEKILKDENMKIYEQLNTFTECLSRFSRN